MGRGFGVPYEWLVIKPGMNMRVTTYVDIQKEIEVDIDVGDFISSIRESSDTRAEMLRGLQQVADFLKGVPDDIIAELSDAQKEIVAGFLAEQKARYEA